MKEDIFPFYENPNLKKVSIKISKNLNYFYDVENKILTPLQKMNRSQKQIFEKENIKEFTIHLHLFMNSVELEKKFFVKKIMKLLQPSLIAEKILKIKKEKPFVSLKKLLGDVELQLIKEISETIIGSDDDPTRVYEFLSEILNLTSKEIENQSGEFKKQLTQELFNQGLEF